MNASFCRTRLLPLLLGLAVACISDSALANDWPQFHGPNGSGISPDVKPLPVKWGPAENLQWKCKLPGPGSSSPIVVGRRVFVTCWTGYGADKENVGEEKDLRRHLLCLDRNSGNVLWDAVVEPVLPEDPYKGMFTEHGYASHTPVSDGERVYVFFGKTGVLAFDLEGKKLWQTSVGTGSGERGWGTSSSPILYKNLLIVPATAESQSLVALNKLTGEEVWRHTDAGFALTWGTPVLVDCGQGRTDLVISVPSHIWGFNPDDGKLRWQCEGLPSDSICSSAFAQGDVVYALETGPRGGGTMAVRAGGEGDVTETRVLWRGKERSRIGTPVVSDGRIYWFGNRIANCIDAATGKQIYQNRISSEADFPAPGAAPPPAVPEGGGRRGGGLRGQDYASPVLANGTIYFVTRGGDAFVYAAGPEFKLLGQNSLAADGGDFSATPAISDGGLFIRSSKFLYCIGTKAEVR